MPILAYLAQEYKNYYDLGPGIAQKYAKMAN
jgi:hypothetical protein